MASVVQTQPKLKEANGGETVAALWRSVTKVERGKINRPSMALRNALAVAIPLASGIAFEHPAAGAAISTGALNVSYSDGADPYRMRARRMLAWSLLGAFAVFSGSAANPHPAIAILLAAAWAFLAGLLTAISQRAADLGLNTLVALIVFSARGPSQTSGAVDAALLVLAGGLLQTGFALLFWPVYPYSPERRAIASAFAELAHTITAQEEQALSEPLSTLPSPQIQDALRALGQDHSLEGERLRLLYDQLERIRLSAFHLRRLQSFTAYHNLSSSADVAKNEQALIACADQVCELAAKLLAEVASDLDLDAVRPELKQFADEVTELADTARGLGKKAGRLAAELSSAIDLFVGQIRSAAMLAGRITLKGASELAMQESALPLRLQMQSWLERLRANLTLRSASFRHGVRMSIFVALASGIGHSISWQRSYWIPMTVAVILRPDFTTTFSRGVLRLVGTLAGLLVATGLYHAIPSTAGPELILITAFTFVLRMYGPANYGIFSIAITGLIVYLLAAVGTPPAQAVVQRGLNTLAGGVLALLAYSVWPTWERRHISDVMADMMDAVRAYFRAVIQDLENPGKPAESNTESARQEWRRAHSVAEASLDRVSAEPNTPVAKLGCFNSMLASSHLLAHTIMSLEAGALDSRRKTRSKALREFAHDVEFTLYFLAEALRGSTHARESLPKLRDAHRRLVEESNVRHLADDYVLVETDRMVVILNTLREQTLKVV